MGQRPQQEPGSAMPTSHASLSRARTAKRSVSLLLVVGLPLTTASSSAGQAPPQLGRASLDEVVDAMTVEEKASLLVGMGMNLPFAIPGLPQPSPEDRAVPEKVPGAAGRTHAIERLGIPSITLADGPAGLRIDPTREGDAGTYHATAFPVATLLSSSWDPALAETVGAAIGREVREYGADVLLAPGMNLHRNPLGGRNFEYYSEDPLLNGRMAAGFVTGVESEGVGTSLKHFAVNSQEFNRLKSNSIVGQRALRELYLRGFEIAVKEAQPWTVMSAYNLVNGTYAPQDRELLTTILRDEWGFEGFVMTDWFAGDDPVAMMSAGNDVIMPGGVEQSAAIIAAVGSGELSEAQLDVNVRRVLRVIMESPTFQGYEYSDAPDLEAHAAIARDAAAQGMVLLKNRDATLPLAAGRSVALFGNASYRPILGGTGSGEVNQAYSIALSEGLANAGFAFDDAVAQVYASYLEAEEADRPEGNILMPAPPIPDMETDAALIRGAAARADVGVYTLGRNSGEGGDREVEGDFDLTVGELALIRELSRAFRAEGKPFVVVLNVAGVTEVARWRDAADAILLAWQPGQEAGNAIADVLSGAVNPSGKLPMSFPMQYSDVPSSRTFPGEVLPEYAEQEQPAGLMAMLNPLPSQAVYDEGIFVGYRYYDTFVVEPAYPFGYGLSYTTFEYGDLELSEARFGDEITARVMVTNTGDVPGREVVQLYVAAPRGSLVKPEAELRAFAKTRLLQPGESQTLAFTLDGRSLASFDPDRSAWIAEAGEYEARAAASSRHVRARARFTLPETLVVEQVHDVMAPDVEIDLLRPTYD
jgi:beta-glucosidase